MKAKLATAKWVSKTRFNFYNASTNTRKGYKSNQSEFDEIRGVYDGEMSVEGMRLYLISKDKSFNELDDDEITENYKINDGDNLYVVSYRWSFNACTVIMTKNGKKIQGVEDEDSCLTIKLRVQDQFNFPVRNIKLFHQTRNSTEVRDYWHPSGAQKNVIGMLDENRPFSKRRNLPQHGWHSMVSHLVAITVEELQIETKRIEEQRKAREAMLAERHRAHLEAVADLRRRIEEARLERERKVQTEKDEQARKK